MEGMLTWENVKLSREQWIRALRATLVDIQRDESVFEIRDVFLDGFCASSRFVHFGFERLDVIAVPLKSIADLFLEVIDDDKVGEERQNIFDLDEVGILEKLHSSITIVQLHFDRLGGCHLRLDVLLVLHDILSNLEPKFLPQGEIILGLISIELGEFDITLFQRQIDTIFPQSHL